MAFYFGEDYKDVLNLSCRRNIDNTKAVDYNCGGYALNTFNWFRPFLDNQGEARRQEIKDRINNHENYYKVINSIAEKDAEFMIDLFEGQLRRIFKVKDAQPNERIILYRIGYSLDEEEDDFHFIFKDYNDKYWSHKPGACKPLNNIFSTRKALKRIWDFTSFNYDSKFIIFGLTLNKKEDNKSLIFL